MHGREFELKFQVSGTSLPMIVNIVLSLSGSNDM